MNFSRIKAVYFRYLYTLLSGPYQIADLFYWPLVDILLWGLMSSWIQSQQAVPTLPLILMTALIFWQITWRGSLDISVNLLQEFWHRNMVNLFSTPLKISEWVMGTILLCICKLIVSILFGTAVVYVLFSLNIFSIGWAFLPFAAMLLVFGWTLGFVASGFIVYWGHRIESFAWMIAFLFAPFSAVYYPVATLPHWAQNVAWFLPTTYIFEGMRHILNKQQFDLSYLAYSFGLNLVFLSIAIGFFIYMFEKSRIKGLSRLE